MCDFRAPQTSRTSSVLVPSSDVSTSPATMPGLGGGRPGPDVDVQRLAEARALEVLAHLGTVGVHLLEIHGRQRDQVEPDVGAAATLAQIGEDGLGLGGGDGVVLALDLAAGAGVAERVDAHHAAGLVDQGAARVAGADRRLVLDRGLVLGRLASGALTTLTAETMPSVTFTVSVSPASNDVGKPKAITASPAAEGPGENASVADRLRRRDLDDGEVVAGRAGHETRRDAAVIGQRHLDRRHPGDDMRVGGDQALGRVDHDAGAAGAGVPDGAGDLHNAARDLLDHVRLGSAPPAWRSCAGRSPRAWVDRRRRG